MEAGPGQAPSAGRRERSVFLAKACRKDQMHSEPGTQRRERGVGVHASLAPSQDYQARPGTNGAAQPGFLLSLHQVADNFIWAPLPRCDQQGL